jgi:hypothetical protein
MFENEFMQAEMVCIPVNLFEDGEWAILEWKDPHGLRGCGFFKIQNGLIEFQRGYWDKLSPDFRTSKNTIPISDLISVSSTF